ncbi:MAG: hypothetical protein Q8R83_05045 [Legionellaceae bacterium]|nr:hypothetical protein [Legionellaceae bacterium]
MQHHENEYYMAMPIDDEKKPSIALQPILNQRTLEFSTSTAKFFEKTNVLLSNYKDDPLFQGLLKSLRRHCNPLLPMASKQYKTQGNYNMMPILIMPNAEHGHILFEAGHEGAHFVGHGVHYLLHELHTLDLIHVAGSVLNSLTFLGSVCAIFVKVLEIWNEHRVLHKIESQLGKLLDYGAAEQDAVYQYVIAQTLSTLQRQRHVVPNPKGWHFLLLTQSILSLSEIHESFETIEELGIAWSEHIIRQFKTYGVYMPVDVIKYKIEDMSIALEVQRILSDRTTIYPEYLSLPQIRGLEGPLQQGLYKLLDSYSHRVWVPELLSTLFCGYNTSQLKIIKSYFTCFNRALQYIQEQKKNLLCSPTCQIQLDLISNALKGHLDMMASALRNTWWTRGVMDLSVQTSMLQICSVPQPIEVLNNDEVGIRHPAIISSVLESENIRIKKELRESKITNAGLFKENKQLKAEKPNNVALKSTDAEESSGHDDAEQLKQRF